MITACFEDEKLNLKEDKLCIDFVNTIDSRATKSPAERLHNYEDLIEWATSIGLIEKAKAHKLLEQAKEDPKNAQLALKSSLRIREALFDIFSAHSHSVEPDPHSLKLINHSISKAMGHLQISCNNLNYELVAIESDDLQTPILWPVVISAAQLLASDELNRMGECLDEDGCAYIFLDKSRNGTQKYCGSKCATRAKVRRYRERQRQSTS
jgi:predicted RNA-binding Zn ribbon-like protein